MMALLFIREGYFTKSSWSFPENRWEESKDWWVGLYTNDDKKVGFIQIQTQPDQLSPYGPAFKLSILSRLETVLFATPVNYLFKALHGSVKGKDWKISRCDSVLVKLKL
jgi:hypothetical protein